ncbi:UDP-N-acetylglucosamine transferase subunit ALG13 [Mucilaginibacter sp. UYNi724]
MIFVTTGTQEPFDRLVKAVDELALIFPDADFRVQAFTASYRAVNINVFNRMPPTEFELNIKSADLIISHAGMGTIISALVNSTPIIVMPRLLKYGEHRNEHQLATAKKLDDMGYVYVAYNEEELIEKVRNIWPGNLKSLHKVGNVASKKLINSLSNFIKQ